MKRLMSLVLSLALLAGMLMVGAAPASAATALEPSEDMIALLKTLEGFNRYPYWDYSQWTVGYGTACPAEDLARYQSDGITEEEAELLLKKHLTGISKIVNNFNVKNSLNMSQNQFDAVLLFTYNLGYAWMYRESNIRTALINGTSGNELMFIMGQWSHVGEEVLTQLVKRRLMEYNIYTNGVYSRTIPDNYCYVLYELNGGKGENDVQCYDSDLTDEIRVNPTKEGYTFAGWYTMNVGGVKVTKLDASVRNMTLYARWVKSGEPIPEDKPGETAPEQTMDPVTVEVDATDVNIRSGPGTNFGVVGQVNRGDSMTITEVQTGTGYTWGKFDGGWIALMYTNYEEVISEEPPATEPPATEPPVTEPPVTEPPATEPPATEPPVTEPPATEPPATEPPATEPPATEPPVTEPPATEPAKVMGTITGDELRIRAGAGTGYEVLGFLMSGDRVEILEQKTVGAMTWGRIAEGWISMTYVKLDQAEPPVTEPPVTEPPVTEPPATEPPTTEPPATEPPATEPPATEPPATEPESRPVMGTVTGDELRVRAGAGTSYEVLDFLMSGTRVEILEQKTAGGMTWGRTTYGWISLDYVDLDEAEESEAVIKMVVADCLRVRSGAGLDNHVVDYLYYGAKVQVLETAYADGMYWARIQDGWVSMDYLK